jgi:hypothetical protein
MLRSSTRRDKRRSEKLRERRGKLVYKVKLRQRRTSKMKILKMKTMI